MKTRGFLLETDFNDCWCCGTCSRLMPDLRKRYAGVIFISENRYQADEVKYPVEAVMDACPAGAIGLNPHTGSDGKYP